MRIGHHEGILLNPAFHLFLFIYWFKVGREWVSEHQSRYADFNSLRYIRLDNYYSC